MLSLGQDALPVVAELTLKILLVELSFSFSRQLIITPSCLLLPGTVSSPVIKILASDNGRVFCTDVFHSCKSLFTRFSDLHLFLVQSVGDVVAPQFKR